MKELRRSFFVDYLKQGGPELKAHMEAAEEHQAEQAKGRFLYQTILPHDCPCPSLYNTYLYFFFTISANPDDLSEVFNLETLADFDLDKLPDIEEYGDDVLGQIQAAMEDLYGDSMAAAMPEDRIQPCLMGVSICLTSYIAFSFSFTYYIY